MAWTEAEKVDLRKYLLAKMTAEQIGDRMGRTRNSIIGYAARHIKDVGFAASRTGRPKSDKKTTLRRARSSLAAFKPLKVRLRLHDQPQPIKTAPTPAAVALHPVPFMGLTPEICHWPLGDQKDPPKLFCGDPKLKGFPYCHHHCLTSYRPENPR